MADQRVVVSGRLSSGSLAAKLSVPPVGMIADYDMLMNKPSVNGVELSGDKTSQELYLINENTASGWNSIPQYIPKRGEICIYTDYTATTDEQGNAIICPEIKIGDGEAYLIDLPFVGVDQRHMILQKLNLHEANTAIHVTQTERAFWNNKLNFVMSGEELIFTRN